MELKLACVPPENARQLWPKVAGLIKVAMRRGDLSSFRGVQDSVLEGNGLLWLAFDEKAIHAAAVTELHETEWRKSCVIVACAGHDMTQWVHMIEEIEKFAKAEGCSAVRIFGREGWQRVLSKYRPKRVVLEKEIA